MVMFDAGDAVEEMAWDFTKYGGGSGVIPEPSDLAIEKFLRKFNVLVTQVSRAATRRAAESDAALLEAKDDEGKDRLLTLEESLEALKKIDLSETNTAPEISEAMLVLVCTLTKNNPSKTQLKKLPNRVRGAFYGCFVWPFTTLELSAAFTR